MQVAKRGACNVWAGIINVSTGIKNLAVQNPVAFTILAIAAILTTALLARLTTKCCNAVAERCKYVTNDKI